MEVRDDLSLLFVLEHVATEMIGDDRPYSLVLGMVPKLTYNRLPPKA